MSSDLQSQLAEIVAPLSPGEFAVTHFGKRAVHLPGPPERAADVMSWTKLCELLNLTSLWTPDRIVLYMDRQRVPPAQYCEVYDEGGRGVQRPSPRLVIQWVDRGASVIVNDVGTLTDGLRSWVACLAWAAGANVQVNLYASRAEHQAFAPHFDTHEVFALNCEGEKVWRLYDLRAETPINHPGFDRTAVPPDLPRFLDREITVTSGDVVYVPRGTYHEALASSHGTLHVTFGVTRPIGLDLVSALWGKLVADGRFREALPLPTGLSPDGDAAFGKHLGDLAERLAALVRDPETQAALKQQLAGFARQARQIEPATFSGDKRPPS